jgi:hypothetical protein
VTNSPQLKRYREKTAVLALTLFAVHLLLCAYFAFAPTARLSRSHIGIFYRRLVLLGPFFGEDRIQTSPHLFARYKEGGEWSPVSDNGLTHSPTLWQYGGRMKQDYVQYLSRSISRSKNKDPEKIRKTANFKRLHHYLAGKTFAGKEPDSVQLIYVVRWYVPETKVVNADTLFNFKYDPREVESR